MESEIRKKLLEKWLCQQLGWSAITLHPLPHDASFRRYYRFFNANGESFIAMDAPPANENCTAFVAIAKVLRANGLQVPAIIKEDLAQGFLLISDFGDLTYLKALNAENADELYKKALDALVILQQQRTIPQFVANFSREFMWQEWLWFKEWFLYKFLGLTNIPKEQLLDECYQNIIESAATQPQVFMHRDYHSANLMLLSNQQVGILDFQDAFIGPLTYDLASLVRDCYIAWPADQVKQWVIYYWQTLCAKELISNVSQEQFLIWFDKMSLQRHLKALITFSRKKIRDNQSSYLKFIPCTLNYLLTVSANYPETTVLHDYLTAMIVPQSKDKLQICVQ